MLFTNCKQHKLDINSMRLHLTLYKRWELLWIFCERDQINHGEAPFWVHNGKNYERWVCIKVWNQLKRRKSVFDVLCQITQYSYEDIEACTFSITRFHSNILNLLRHRTSFSEIKRNFYNLNWKKLGNLSLSQITWTSNQLYQSTLILNKPGQVPWSSKISSILHEKKLDNEPSSDSFYASLVYIYNSVINFGSRHSCNIHVTPLHVLSFYILRINYLSMMLPFTIRANDLSNRSVRKAIMKNDASNLVWL